MKKILLGVIMTVLLSTAYSQYGVMIDYKKETWSKLKNSKLYVVYEDGGTSKYDKALKEAISTNWNVSKFEYIAYAKFETLQKVESNFFLVSVNLEKSKAGRYTQNMGYLYLVHGYKKGAKNGNINNFPQLAAMQMGDIARETYLPLLIKHLNRNVEQVLLGKLKSLGGNTKKLNANRSKIKRKPLYILDIDLNKKMTSVADIKKGYSGKVFVVSEKELAAKINSNEDVNVFFCARSSSKSYVHVYNALTGEEYYNSFNLISKKWPAGIIPYHFKKWNK